jgi:hypothetical protein
LTLKWIRDYILLREGPKDIIWNHLKDTGAVDWRKARAKRPNDQSLISVGNDWISKLVERLSVTAQSINSPAESDAVSHQVISNQNEDASTFSHESLEEDNVQPYLDSPSQPIITEQDFDPATSIEMDKVNFEFLKLYLLVGLVCVEKEELVPSQPAAIDSDNTTHKVFLHSSSLVLTEDYIYLFSERFDVYPPPLYPPESNPQPHVSNLLFFFSFAH